MAKPQRQIIALGGGGFSMEPDNLLLDRYILEQSPHLAPKVCFLPTASGDSDRYITRFYDAFTRLDCKPSHLSLFRPPAEGPAAFIKAQDIIYVGGGSTFNLLAIWRAWQLEAVLRQVWENGTILCGLSAGSLCWFEEGLSDSVVPGQYAKLSALGFLAGSHCPHYDGESERRPIYQRRIREGHLASGIAADDGVALHYIERELSTVVSSRPVAKAYRVYLNNQELKEESVVTHYLGKAI
ncbi:peptidase E [cf. Phormidesmis sp. LEGE 11477]|uniref:Type 1 glutamine amidotransferase-like domain-containing protein n=1 Tax=cf. Phormidesmis sp. LEGE 11477 TaxID=1828680 RepID=UPI00188081B4|nr:peptidase E [cf. Phormidesmis sp. LEGE 11477]MBE9062028.1 peptidase E [cf. Phormidesmis sp. LEGE 11477]